jgi:RimJ/RimL family protein N-acetyltransferase
MKIDIRRYKESDALEFQQAVLESVDHLGRWLPWCTSNYSIEDAQAWASGAAQTWSAGTDYRFVIEDYHASNAVASKLGATYEGTFRNKIFHDGNSRSANCYSIIPSDYGL